MIGLVKDGKFKDFNESIDFVNKVAKIAETQNHHPDIEINYDKVKISITDHEKGGVFCFMLYLYIYIYIIL